MEPTKEIDVLSRADSVASEKSHAYQKETTAEVHRLVIRNVRGIGDGREASREEKLQGSANGRSSF